MATREEIEGWIASSALGDRQAFSALYDATSAKLFGVCLRVLHDRGKAEETIQDIYLKVWQNADRYAANGLSPMTWLITIARNTAIDRLRRERPTEALDEERAAEIGDSAATPEQAAVAASEAARIRACLGELEDKHREAVRRVYLEGWSYRDLASRFDVPLNTMKTWLRRSLLKLKDCMSR